MLKSGASLTFFAMAGCVGNKSDGVTDSDDDGMIDSKDYAPNDPDVQEKSDIEKSPTQTTTPTPTPTSTPKTTTTSTVTTIDLSTPTTTQILDSDGDGVADSRDDFPDNASYSENINRESATEIIDPGYYRWWTWSLEKPAVFSFEVDVVSGSHVDAILIDDSQFDEFEDGKEYEYYTNGSDFKTKYADKHLRIDSGSYRFIISNWNTGTEEKSEVDLFLGSAR